MSDYEYHKGKVQEVCKDVKGIKNKIIEAENRFEVDIKKHCDDWDLFEEYPWLEDSSGFVVIRGLLFKVLEDRKEYELDNICEAHQLDEDIFEYTLYFYNGGTCYSEMLDDAVGEIIDGGIVDE